jgi:hypothetical protein
MKNGKLINKKELKKLDWIVLITFLLFVGTHATTQGILAYRSSIAQELEYDAKVVNIVEANPLARMAFNTQRLGISFLTLILPATLLGAYAILRKYLNEDHLGFIVTTWFFAAVINILNDLSIFFGYLAQHWRPA